MVQLGDTYLWDPEGGDNNHLWIVLTKPDPESGKCVIINLTSSTGGQYALTLKIGDHPYIRKNSDVNFGDAMISSVEQIEKAVRLGCAYRREPMGLELLQKIAETAKTHNAPARGIKKLVEEGWKGTRQEPKKK
jgi:hypothetical protein